MTREEAVADAERRQRSDPDRKWIAVERDGEWVVASIGIHPTSLAPTGTATAPPPPTPHDDPYSALQRVTNQYGIA
jgi:hypothetical protein